MDGYPKDALDLRQMNRALRHKLRNLCSGVKMTMDRLAEATAQTQPNLSGRCMLINAEMDSLQLFTERLDRLFDALPEPQPLTLFELASSLRESFIKEFPLCSFVLDGPEVDVNFAKGSWLRWVLTELMRNAGEAAGAEGSVVFSWDFADGGFSFSIENGGVSIPADLPLDPPRPFHCQKSRHDGLGLAIAFRICNEAPFRLDWEKGRGDGASAQILIPPGDFLNGQA